MKIEGATDAQYTPDTSEEDTCYYFVVADKYGEQWRQHDDGDIVARFMWIQGIKIRRRKEGEEKTRMGKG